jgi:hypothetical protein
MNKFRKLGFIDYNGRNGGIEVHCTLLDVVLHEERVPTHKSTRSRNQSRSERLTSYNNLLKFGEVPI